MQEQEIAIKEVLIALLLLASFVIAEGIYG